MFRAAFFCATIALTLGTASVGAQDSASELSETVQARRALMNQLGSLQALIDARLSLQEFSYELYDLAQSAAASLDAFALLLPVETNLLGGANPLHGADTTASPQIWDDLPAFQKLVRQSADQARIASESADLAAFSAAWGNVSDSCTACHQTYVSFDPFAAPN